jgi:hypothetical protein
MRPPPSIVKLIVFKRFDNFYNLFQHEDLAAYRDALGSVGLSMDLCDDKLKLGAGKLVLDDIDLASELVNYLYANRVQENIVEIKGKRLNKSCVFVNAETEPLVRYLVMENSRAKTPIKRNPIKNEPGYFLDLKSPQQIGNRTSGWDSPPPPPPSD